MNVLLLFLSENIYFYYSFVALVGILLGSFLNLVIYRLPKMMEQDFTQEIFSFIEEHAVQNQKSNLSTLNITLNTLKPEITSINLCLPHSFCPVCKHKLNWWHNIPLLSCLILKFKCYFCQTKISSRYFFIEALTGIILLFCAIQFGVSFQAFWAMVFSLALITLFFIDLDHQLLPDSITLPLTWLGLILSIFGVFIYPNTAIIGACVGYLILWSVYWVFKLITKKEGMGYGDFKLLAALGAWLGWQQLPSILLISALSGTVIALGLRALKKLEAGQPIPFGPFLAISGWLNLLWGNNISQFYYRLFI